MKTRLPRQEFLDALGAIAAVTSGRTTKPILGCVRLTTEADVVELSATDGEAALRLRVQSFSVDEPGGVVVQAQRLLDIVREMPDAEVVMTSDDRQAVVRGAGSQFKIFAQALDDFPPVPEFDHDADLVLDGAQLRRMIALTTYAAARETGRYAINGVLWKKVGRRLFLVATDGRRLARSGGAIAEAKSADFDAIVPTKALNVFERVFPAGKAQGEWKVDIKVLPNQLLLRSGDRLLSTALVEGNFPDFEKVIPRDLDKTAKLPRDEFQSAIRQAALLASDDVRAVKLAFEGQQLVITSQSVNQGEARVELPVEFEGGAVAIGFNPNFLVDALKVLPGDHVRIELKDGVRPGIVFGEDKGDFLYVLMPVSL